MAGTVVTIRDRAYLEATHAVLDTPEMRKQLAKLSGAARDEFIETVGVAVGAAIRSAWDAAHKEGHTCKSPFCGRR